MSGKTDSGLINEYQNTGPTDQLNVAVTLKLYSSSISDIGNIILVTSRNNPNNRFYFPPSGNHSNP